MVGHKFYLLLHGCQECFVVLVVFHLLLQLLHNFNRSVVLQKSAQNPNVAKLGFRNQKLFFACAGFEYVYSRPNTFFRYAAV